MEKHGPKHLAKLQGKGSLGKDIEPEIEDELDDETEE